MRRKAFTLIELLVVVAIIALLISILLPSLARARELSKRAVCGKNLNGIGQAVATYAADRDNRGFYPVPAHADPGATAGLCGVDYVDSIAKARFTISTDSSGEISTTRSFWMLVRAPKSPVTPKLCICPSSDGTPNTDVLLTRSYDFGPEDLSGATFPNTDGYKQISYGIQVPYGAVGRATMECDTQMPLAADKGWYSAWKGGGGYTPATNLQTVQAVSTSTIDGWKPWNSPNHGGPGEGEGQNVLFSDFHVDFARTPIVGMGMDNIYTRWPSASATLVNRVQGSMGDNYAPFSNTDTLIYP